MVTIQDSIDDLVYISKLFGSLSDVVQSGGGNTSIKYKNIMLIKSSGIHLSEVASIEELSKIDTEGFDKLFRNNLHSKYFEKKIERAIKLKSKNKNIPSIETAMHIFLEKVVLHTHPTSILSILSSKNAKKIIKNLYKNFDYLVINYKTPGVSLAKEILIKYLDFTKKNNRKPKIVFLLNHGLIVHSENIQDVIMNQIQVVRISDNYFRKKENKNSNYYNLFEFINEKKLQHNTQFIYQSDLKIPNYFFTESNFNKLTKLSLFPDKVVYCGKEIICLNKHNFKKKISNFYIKFNKFPKIIILEKSVYIFGKNLAKTREIEDVFSTHINLLNNNKFKKLISLKKKEIDYLQNWDAEKYREEI